MSTIVTRAGKGTSLSWAEADANFTNLNTDKIQVSTITGTAGKTAPVDADLVPIVDSVGTVLNKVTWANIKATLKTYFDTLYTALSTCLPLSGGTLTGKVIFKSGLNNIASAATVDITGVGAGNTIHITGSTGIGAWTMTSGQVVDVVFDSALLLGHNATTFNLPGGANFVTAAGDRMRLWYDGTTVWCLNYERANGVPVGPAASLKSTTTTVDVSAAAAPANGQILKATSSTTSTWQDPIALGTPIATTSGSAIGYTGLPTTIKRITINFSSVSTNGTAVLRIQIGPSGGYESTNYFGGAGDRGSELANSTGFIVLRTVAAGSLYSGSVVLSLESSSTNTWTQKGIISLESSGQPCFSSGKKALAGVLDRVQVITTDTFTGGEINILYE